MSYELQFLPSALKQWKKLSPVIKKELKKRLVERCKYPHVPSARLQSLPHTFKIKLHSLGYRCVYQVKDQELIVLVIAIGKREHDQVYREARKRI